MSAVDAPAVEAALCADADALIFDIGALVPAALREKARASLGPILAEAKGCGAELFIRFDGDSPPGLRDAPALRHARGVIVSGQDCACDVQKLDTTLARLEAAAGLEVGSLELTGLIDSAAALWRVKEVVGASSRMRQAWLDEAELCASLGIAQAGTHDQLAYARGRFISECVAARVQPIGSGGVLSMYPPRLSAMEVERHASDAQNLGFKGLVCFATGWVGAVNSAFTPTKAQTDYAEIVRAAFAAGLARGTAAVPLNGRMVDTPVAKLAAATLERARACARRDQAKRQEVRR